MTFGKGNILLGKKTVHPRKQTVPRSVAPGIVPKRTNAVFAYHESIDVGSVLGGNNVCSD